MARNLKPTVGFGNGTWGNNGFKRNNGRPQNNFQSNNSQGRYSGRGQSDRNISGFGRGRGRFDKSPNVSRPIVTSRMVSRDATRCYYCKEPGHISRFCERCEEDENRLKRGSSNLTTNIDGHFETDEGYGDYDDLYDGHIEYLNN